MIEDFIPEQNTYRQVIIYGTTFGGELLYHALEKQGIAVLYFCDEYSEYKTFCSVPVIKKSDLLTHADVPVILAVARSLEAVYTSLMAGEILNPIFTAKYIVERLNWTEYFPVENAPQARAFISQYPIYVDSLSNTCNSFPTMEVFITEKCTLRCKNCSHMVPNYTRPKDYSIKSIIQSIERLLEYVRIDELIILGGEPFLHPHLDMLLNWYIGRKECFGSLSILTNGTVIPQAHILELMRQAGASVRISDYGSLSAKKDKLKKYCQEASVSCSVLYEKWMDFGCGETHQYSEEDLKRMFLSCPFSQDFLLMESRLYKCAHGAHLYNQNIIPVCQDDYLDLQREEQDLNMELTKIFSHTYLNACRFCNGARYDKLIEPAVQMK